jgi:hypothetical protein
MQLAVKAVVPAMRPFAAWETHSIQASGDYQRGQAFCNTIADDLACRIERSYHGSGLSGEVSNESTFEARRTQKGNWS